MNLLQLLGQGHRELSNSLAFSRTIGYSLIRIKSILTIRSETVIHNHPILYLLVLTLAVPFMVSCEKAAKDTTAEDSQAIRAASKQWDDNFNSGNSAAVAALYAEEAKILPPNSQMLYRPGTWVTSVRRHG